MTAARSTSTKAAIPAEPVKEPENLRELYLRAAADLERAPKGTILKWVFWHAKAVGRLEVARAVLKRFESRDWDIHARALAFMPGTAQFQAAMDTRPTADITRAQDYVVECGAYVQAAWEVLTLLKDAA